MRWSEITTANGAFASSSVERVGARSVEVMHVVVVLEREGHRLEDGFLVVDDQDAGARGCPWRWRVRGRALTR